MPGLDVEVERPCTSLVRLGTMYLADAVTADGNERQDAVAGLAPTQPAEAACFNASP